MGAALSPLDCYASAWAISKCWKRAWLFFFYLLAALDLLLFRTLLLRAATGERRENNNKQHCQLEDHSTFAVYRF
jgi:hypothetical protein